jgi:hypothetical protein
MGQAHERVPNKKAALTAGGGSDGFVAIGDNTGFYPGGIAWLSKADGSDQQKCLVTELRGTAEVGLRFIPESVTDPKLRDGTVTYPNYGRSDCSGFLATDTLFFPTQVVPVHQPIFDPLPKSEL